MPRDDDMHGAGTWVPPRLADINVSDEMHCVSDDVHGYCPGGQTSKREMMYML